MKDHFWAHTEIGIGQIKEKENRKNKKNDSERSRLCRQ
jgi:hypothetical protein